MLGTGVVLGSIGSFDPREVSVHTISLSVMEQPQTCCVCNLFSCKSNKLDFISSVILVLSTEIAFSPSMFLPMTFQLNIVVITSRADVTTVSMYSSTVNGVSCVFRPFYPPDVGLIRCWMTLIWLSAATCPASPRERRRDTSSAR